MSCDNTKGRIQLPCKDAVGGMKSIMIANYDDYGFTTASADTGHDLTSLGSLAEVYKYELKNSGNKIKQDAATSRDNGTTIWTTTLDVILQKIGSEMEYQMKMLSLGRPIIFVELNSGQVIVIGKEFGCEVTTSSSVDGTLDSLNGYTLSVVATEREPFYYLDSTSITALAALVSADNI